MQALTEAARRKNSALVAGIDPALSRLPEELRALPETEATLQFCTGILEAVEPYVAAVKLQAAYFERLGPVGMEIYRDLISAAEDLGLPVIADVKRGDIGPVAAAYAEAHLGVYGATCVTVNPYMGEDAILPFLEEARRQDRGGGVFVLVATSNPSSSELQQTTDPPLCEKAAELVAKLGKSDGDHPDAGAVVGVTRPEIGARARELLPQALFLSPGYGAQGGVASGMGGFETRPPNGEPSGFQIEKACATARMVTSTVAAATTAPNICTRLSLVISSFPGVGGAVFGR
jgi:orotidine-5'-phosphate decarboxylase